ncbi:hypothetical protein FB566_5223 [Stackebrandtia endophytica]|uniref:Uncharacterized protein n=1 Tax=Stackebrandtia endophytica TaxID=1496996 RepID=A0A543B496_9ACTN|nr:hypothetical protein [Stackebrandtia endophytica]TQL79613.1 hypothetical protein FB566_5223 [Stackebrandtia endophytica]
MGTPSGFDYVTRKDGTVVITHHGKAATRLRGPRAAEFLDEAEYGDPQEVMARWTGNYKHGNERMGRNTAKYRAGR